MRIKFSVAIVAVVSMAVATFVNPVVAGAAAPSAESAAAVLASCASPPDTEGATVANRDEYVSLWIGRLKDKAFLKTYNAAKQVPAAIKAEGFHDLDGETQLWLNSCLVDRMLEVAGETAGPAKINQYLAGLNMIIFGKAGIQKMREELTNPATEEPAETLPTKKDQTAEALEDMTEDLIDEPSVTSEDQPKADVETPKTTTTPDSGAVTTDGLQSLVNAPEVDTTPSAPQTLNVTPNSIPTGLEPHPITQLPLVPQLLAAVNSVLKLVSQIQAVLFTLPVVNILASVFYKICAESATMPLACSISLPVGVPIPADVTGDNVPDVFGTLGAFTNLKDIGAKFQVARISPNSGPLPAHVFAVYDTPIVKKRIEFGVDGRASTLATTSEATFTLVNAVKALAGDIEVKAELYNKKPGSTQALSFAIKDLVGGSIGVQPSEENPLGGAVQMSPFPERFEVGARLTHTPAKSQDTFTVSSATPTKVNAIIDQRTTTTPLKSQRRFTAEVDKLPTSVVVDLVRNGENQSIDYAASAPIDGVKASDKTIVDTSHPESYTESIYAVKGVPTSIGVDLAGAQDITYAANAKIPEVSFSTQTFKDAVLQQQINAKAHQVPKNIHVTNLTNAAEQRVGYTADDKLGDVELGMYDIDEAGITTNLVAKATGIPKQLEFVSTKATGAYDLTSDTGIDLIEATLTRNNGLVLPLPGKDHATVYKRGEQLGLDFRLSGFKSAHFDGHEETNVALGLNPGGQTFDAIADIDDPGTGPNVLATAHVGALPSSIEVAFDPDNGTADYEASSIIPLLKAAFTDRDTEMFGNATLTDLPKNIGLGFNTSGEVPEVTYDADSRLGSIDLNYSEKPGGLAIHGLITDLPEYMKIGGIDPIVFDARTSAGAASGSSYLGQILFQYGTDGTFVSPATSDDHIYLDTDEVDTTHAELQYSGLKYLGVDTSNEELHATIKNSAARLLRAYVTTPNLELTGFIDKVPAEITIAQVGNLVSYDASSAIDEISTNLERANGDEVAVQIQDVPSSIDLLFDGAGSKLVWDASAPTGLVSAEAHLTGATLGQARDFDAGLTITDIPVHWDADWAGGNVLFQAPAPGIGSIAARVTNHGTFHVLSGDHLSAYYDEQTGDLDASLRISNLRKAGFTKLTGANGGGFEASLNMGNQSAFKLAADVTVSAGKIKANGQFDRLPSAITLRSDGGRITYNGDSNPDLTLAVEAGQSAAALAATPTPPTVHGVAVRDGASGASKAVKANLYLTGLPDNLDLNSPAGTYEVNGYHPSISALVVDVHLTELAPKDVKLNLTQGVPTASPVNFTFGPFLSSTAGNGDRSLSLNYTANQDLGALDATVIYDDTDQANLYVSNIPASIAVNALFGADTKTIGITMSHGIDEIRASVKKPSAFNLAASVKLTDVPSAVNIVIGKDSDAGNGTNVDAPVFQMHNSAAGLDIEAAVTGEISDPVDASAAVSLNVTDLGKDVTAGLAGNVLQFNSSPATGSFLLQAAGRVQKTVDLFWDGGIFQNRGSLGVDLKIKKITVGLNDFADVNLRLGFTTGLDGTFSSFTLGQESDLNVNLREKFYVYIDWPDPFGSDDIDLVDIGPLNIDLDNVVPSWRINKNTFGEIFDIPFFHFGFGECAVNFNARPGPGYTAGSTFTVGAPEGAPGHTPAWLFTPDISLLGISLPNFALDVVAYFLSPYGREIDEDVGCEVFDIF